MINLLSYLAIILSSILPGCQQNESIDKYSSIWNAITLESEGQQITIYGARDSVVLKQWDYRDSLTENERIWIRIPFNIRTENIKIKKEEMNHIYTWSKKLITDFALPEKFCTDYVGHLRLTIQYTDQIKQSCEYSSICEWRVLNSETKKLNELLEQKFKMLK